MEKLHISTINKSKFATYRALYSVIFLSLGLFLYFYDIYALYGFILGYFVGEAFSIVGLFLNNPASPYKIHHYLAGLILLLIFIPLKWVVSHDIWILMMFFALSIVFHDVLYHLVFMPILAMQNECIILENKNAKYDVMLLHGFTKDKFSYFNMAGDLFNYGYTTISCDARGHGKNKKGKMTDWKGTIEDYNEIINSRKNPVILIGKSMGGTESITLGLKNKKIVQVFGLGAMNGQKILDNQKLKQFYSKVYQIDFTNPEIVNDMINTFPSKNVEACKKENNEKYFLLHAEHDGLVPISEMYDNKEQLCLDDKNIFVFKSFGGDSRFWHFLPQYSKKTTQFILKNIKK